ncbi:MAG TPA: LPS assembly protein LptD, partial [Gammaproteobacteria bacterium]
MRETAQSSPPASRCLPVALLLAVVMGSPAVQAGEAATVTAKAAPDSMTAMPVATPPGFCSPAVTVPERMTGTWQELERLEAVGLASPEAPVAAEADRMALQRDGVSRLEGNVWLQHGGQFISTEVLEFNESTGVVRTLAPARFGSRELLVDSETAVYDTRVGEGRFENAEFHLLGRSGRGNADVLAKTGESTARMTGVKYTTCPPDDEDWWLKASSMNLDQETGMGVGRNVRIAFMGVPFFYTPWISFPIDDRRKTGFLFPEFGDSGRHGPWLRLPYYLNLAPNLDATLTPFYMTDRGTMLQSQFRYLFNWGEGELDADYLDDDRLTDSRRYHYAYRHASTLPADWQFRLSYQQVSDEEYFQDFSDSGRANLISHLAQVATLSRTGLEHGVTLR